MINDRLRRPVRENRDMLDELMAHLGHSSPRAALIYQHATEERDREIAEWQDDVIAEAKRRANEKKRAPVAKLPTRSAKGS